MHIILLYLFLSGACQAALMLLSMKQNLHTHLHGKKGGKGLLRDSWLVVTGEEGVCRH